MVILLSCLGVALLLCAMIAAGIVLLIKVFKKKQFMTEKLHFHSWMEKYSSYFSDEQKNKTWIKSLNDTQLLAFSTALEEHFVAKLKANRPDSEDERRVH